jgi:hypothetical protein
MCKPGVTAVSIGPLPRLRATEGGYGVEFVFRRQNPDHMPIVVYTDAKRRVGVFQRLKREGLSLSPGAGLGDAFLRGNDQWKRAGNTC